MLTRDEVNGMAKDFYSYLESNFCENYVISWSDEKGKLPGVHPKKGGVFLSSLDSEGFFSADIDVIGYSVYNKATQKKQRRRMGNDIVYMLGNVPFLKSVGYPEYYLSEIMPNLHDSKEFLKALHKLYDLEGQYYVNLPYTHEIQASMSAFSSSPWDMIRTDSYKGKIRIGIMLYSLGNDLDSVAESLLVFSEMISQKYANINASIYINTMISEYSNMFCSHNGLSQGIISLESLQYNQEYIYLQNVGWANIIAPYTRPLMNDAFRTKSIIAQDMHGGGLMVRHKKTISEMMISDLKEMKLFLYNILISGKMYFPIDFDGFRGRWEYIPVFEDEIRIDGNQVIFEHVGGPNVKYIKDVLGLTNE
jgi:hypothetical protein